jgi:prepilin-type N-terminal cleavage/methylation domain-containing protein
MKVSTKSSRSCQRGFTLIEILVAITVLALLSIMLAQIVSMAIQGTNASLRKADSIGQIRLVLDRFGNDWDNRLRRTDAPFTVLKNEDTVGNNDSVSFYSTVNGFSGSGSTTSSTSMRPQLSQVDYVMDSGTSGSPTMPSLKRGALNTLWTSSSTGNLLQLGSNSLSLISFAPYDYHYQTLSDDLCRFKVCFLLKSTGKIVANQPANSQDIGAVVVSIASMDHATRTKLAASMTATQYLNLFSPTASPAIFVDPADGTTTTPADQWNANLQTYASSLPTLVRQNVRVSQRTYYIR